MEIRAKIDKINWHNLPTKLKEILNYVVDNGGVGFDTYTKEEIDLKFSENKIDKYVNCLKDE